MKRRLQDISNHEGLDESQSGRKSPDIRRRRVAMEKRRRDKINQYLDELSNLVPEAAEKMNCTKLEKAEVLEMTVDYVRRLTKEKKGPLQPSRMDPELERKRGFMTCLSHIKSYLENQTILPLAKTNDQSKSTLDSRTASTGCISLNSTLSGNKEPPLPSSKQVPSSSSQQDVFNKICSDFLKNNSSAVTDNSVAEQTDLASFGIPLQQQLVLHDSTHDYTFNNSVYINNIDLGYSSFLSAINGP